MQRKNGERGRGGRGEPGLEIQGRPRDRNDDGQETDDLTSLPPPEHLKHSLTLPIVCRVTGHCLRACFKLPA